MSSGSAETTYIGAIDQGTSSTRFILFNGAGDVVDTHQIEIEQIYTPGMTGWTEHDPMELLRSVQTCIKTVMARHTNARVAAIGITNQRETSLIWNSVDGRPMHNAVVWHDSRTDVVVNKLIERYKSRDIFRSVCGLPVSTYFSGIKLHWMLHVAHTLPPKQRRSLSDQLPDAVKNKTAMFGTIDTWLIWNLTGGVSGGVHVTDVTNASRTMLMDLETCSWHEPTAQALSIPLHLLPKIKSSSEVYGHIKDGPLKGVPISGCLGDQQAATVGQLCFESGNVKNTYGTGCFMLMNTGTKPVHSQHGLLTTVCYQLGAKQPVVFALEGSVAVAGAGIRWLRDEMKLIKDMKEINELVSSTDTGGMYFVPAFSGLLSPYWRPDARGVAVGLTHSTNRAHFVRAVVESSAYQSFEILEAMTVDSGIDMTALRVDGGMARNDTLLQFQADLLKIDVIRPRNLECTAAGAAYAAGLAVGFWPDMIALKEAVGHGGGKVFNATMDEDERKRRIAGWKKAVTRTFDWANADGTENDTTKAPTNVTSRL